MKAFNGSGKLLKTWLALLLIAGTTSSAFAQTLPDIDEPTTPNAEYAALTARMDADLSTLQSEHKSIATTMQDMRKDIENKIDESNRPIQKSLSDVSSTLRTTALITSIISAVSAILALIILLRVSHVIGATNAAQPAVQPAHPSSSQQAQNPATAAALARIEERLAAISRTPQNNKPSSDSSSSNGKETLDKLNTIEAAIQNLAARKEASANHGTDSIADTIWPKSARSAENFPIWRKTLSDALAAEKPEALALAASLLEFQSNATKRDIALEPYAEAITKLGKCVYNYCYSLENVPETDRLDIVSSLVRAIKEDAQKHSLNMDVRAFFPNDRLNTDAMEKLDSGNRLTVQRPLSWLIVERTGSRERIIHRAQVITG